MDAVPDLVLVFDSVGRILDWNKPVLLAAGIVGEDLLYKPVRLLVHDEDRAGMERAILTAAAEGTARVAARLSGGSKPEQTYDWILTSVAPMAGVGQALLAVGRGRTNEQRAASLLELATQVYRLTASGASVADMFAQFAVGLSPLFGGGLCSVLVMESDGAHFRHVAAPGLPAGYLAVAERVPVGLIMGSAAPEAHREETVIVRDLTTDPRWAPYRDAVLCHGLEAGWFVPIWSASGGLLGALAVYDRRFRHPSAADRWVAERAAGVVQMAIEWRQGEERLRQSEELFRGAYHEHPCLNLIVGEDGTILSANQLGARQFGFRVEELVGRPAAVLFHDADRAVLSQGLADCFAHPGFSCKWELRQASEGERLRWVRVSASVTRSLDGRRHAVVSCEDITVQKRQEEELIGAKNRFESFMRYFPGVAFIKDEEGRHLFANLGFERMLGLRPCEWNGKTNAELFPDDIAERFSEHDRAVLASGEPFIGNETTRQNGEEQGWLVVKFPVRDGGGRTFLGGIALDVTERQRAERKLRESHALLCAVMAATEDAIYLKDTEGRYLLANDAYGRMIGKSISEIIGRRAADLFPTAIAEQIGAHDRLVMERGSGHMFEQVLEINGAPRAFLTAKAPFLDGQGRVAGVVGFSRDITERMQAEERVRQSEARFRSLIQHASDMTMVLDRHGVILYESPVFYRIFGYSHGEIMGRSLFELIHPEDLSRARDAFSVVVHQPRAAAPVEFRMRKADGTYLMVETVGSNLLGDPSVRGIVLNSRDVTERHRLAEQLRQAQKMEAIGRLAGGIAHDFNNILTVISGYSEVILRRAELEDALRKPVEEIRKAASRASTLTNQLLSFSRQQVLQRHVLNLNDVISDALDMLQRLVGAHVRFVTELDPRLRPISADPTQMEQVLMNLAINARDAMPDGGTVWIATSNLAQVPPAVRLSIRDNGKGMDAETLSRVFEPFFTTKARGQGTGLGLAMVYGIIAQHGGTVTADSVPGRGTIFVIDLPCVREGAGPIEPASASAPSSPATETVLVVDDEDAVREFVCAALRSEGYRVLDARNGDEAWARFGTSEETIDVLLTDMIMPGVNGRQLGERLRQARPGLKVVLMSGYTDDDLLRKGEGPDVAFLQKPFKIDALLRVVRQELMSGNAGSA